MTLNFPFASASIFKGAKLILSVGDEEAFPKTVYIDELSVEFGRVFNEEDNSYIEKIEALIAEIKELPDGAKASDETAIAAAFEKYNSLPDLYKSAIVNFNDLSSAMKNLLYI